MDISGNTAISIDHQTIDTTASSSATASNSNTGLDTITIAQLHPVQASEENEQQITKKDIEDTVDALKEMTTTLQTKMDFSINQETNRLVVKVVDQDTEKVIRQFPPEELLELQEKMIDLTGFLFSADA
jgi:flagellar protein FlaG